MTQWHATVEHDQAITHEQAEPITAAEQFVVVRIDRSAGETGRTWVSFGVDAPTLKAATDTALRTARDLTGGVAGEPISIRVLTDDDLAAEIERPTVPEIVDTTEACEILGGISRQRLHQLQKEHADFPAPIRTFASGRSIFAKAAIVGFKARRDQAQAGAGPRE